jgi:hypothetical protein
MYPEFESENRKGRYPLRDIGVGGRIILKRIINGAIVRGMALDRVQWWVPFNKVMNLLVP